MSDCDVDMDSEDETPLQDLVPLNTLRHEAAESSTTDPLQDCLWKLGDHPVPRYNFTGNPGINMPLPDDPSIMDFVRIIIPDDMYGIMAMETNRYARDYLNCHATLRPSSRFRQWEDVSVSDMRAFVALTIAMGLVRQDELDDYWSTDEVVATPFFGSIMSRNQFENIMSFFRLAPDNLCPQRGEDGYNPINKLGAPYTLICQNFHTS